jgi:hypothetical protein
MRFRRAVGGEIGVFEDMQTLVIIVVGIVILLGSTLYNWTSFEGVVEDQELYDEAEHILRQIEGWDYIRSRNSYDSQYEDFHLWQLHLANMTMPTGTKFEDRIRSDLHYSVTFDDLAISDGEDTSDRTTGEGDYSKYQFGETIPEGKDTIALQAHYTLIMGSKIRPGEFDVRERHPCLVTVVVWR